jgi:hypothetical protein
MSWHFSQAVEAVFLEGNSLGGKLSAQWKLTPTAQDDLCSGKMRDTFHLSPFGMMFVPSTESRGAELLTWFLADSRARILAPLEMVMDWTEREAGYGWKWPESLTKYDQNLRLWKTRQCSLLADWEEFLATWPKWGLMLDGEVLPLEMKVPRLKGSDYLLPAPTKSMGKRGWGLSRTGRERYSKQLIDNALSFGYKPPPALLEWTMGWPLTWSQSVPLGTDRFQQWLRAHGGF